MGGAIGWGTLAASSLVLGTLLGTIREWPKRAVGLVLAFGAGALISAVSFELAGEAIRIGGLGWTAIGLTLGAFTYFLLDLAIERRFSGGPGRSGRAAGSQPGAALALGAFLDGIPEQLVLGIGLAGGAKVSVGLLVAIFVSNLPEAIGSASAMRKSGTARRTIYQLWSMVALICVLATVVGYALADVASGELRAVINGFAAGALLVMLIDSMIPEARSDGGRVAGLITVLGFAVAAALSSLS